MRLCQDGPLGEPAVSRVGCLSPLQRPLSPSSGSGVRQLASLAQERGNEGPRDYDENESGVSAEYPPGVTGESLDQPHHDHAKHGREGQALDPGLAVPRMSATARSSVITRSTKSKARSIR